MSEDFSPVYSNRQYDDDDLEFCSYTNKYDTINIVSGFSFFVCLRFTHTYAHTHARTRAHTHTYTQFSIVDSFRDFRPPFSTALSARNYTKKITY